jgi:hypothetical protein
MLREGNGWDQDAPSVRERTPPNQSGGLTRYAWIYSATRGSTVLKHDIVSYYVPLFLLNHG